MEMEMPNGEMSDSDRARYEKAQIDLERNLGWAPGTIERILTGR
jgi:hypothetical protein